MSSGKRIFGAFSVAIALFFVWPAIVGGWMRVNAMRAAVAEREEILLKREEILADVQEQYAELFRRTGTQEGQKFSAFVPVKKDAAEVVSALQGIAVESGATLLEVRTSEPRPKSGQQQKVLSLSIDLQGSYASLRGFLAGMEQYVRLVNVQSIEAAPDSRQPGLVRFAIEADAYFLQ